MASSQPELIDLEPNKSLLDVNFDGYKLSLDSFPIFSSALPFPVRSLEPSNSQFGLDHANLYNDINHLFFDAHSSTSTKKVFFMVLDDHYLYGCMFDLQKRSFNPTWKVLAIASGSADDRLDRYPVTVSFPDANYAFLSDGCGTLFLYETGDRNQSSSWKEITRMDPCLSRSEKKSFIISESRRVDQDRMDVILRLIIPKGRSSGKENFWNEIVWITYTLNDGKWCSKNVRCVDCQGHLEMVTLDTSSDNMIIASMGDVLIDWNPLAEKHCRSQSLSEEMLEKQDEVMASTNEAMECDSKKAYVWSQVLESVTAVFSLDEIFTKSDISFSVHPESVNLSVRGQPLLVGKLGGKVDCDASTYTFDKKKLELTLFKSELATWTELVLGDHRGCYEEDPSILSTAYESLEKFSGEAATIDESGMRGFNTEQLEECDVSAEEIHKIRWLNDKSGEIIRECDISGRNVLFSVSLGFEPKSLCLRMDVDGILWMFSSDEGKPVIHRATFNAFGYVQASKTERKFSSCPPDCSYAVLVEGKRHAFVYWQSSAISSDMTLRNRQCGRTVGVIAKQNLISLNVNDGSFGDSEAVSDNVMGLHADNRILLILTQHNVFCVILKEGETGVII
ncbi:hypothetical protein AB6A40_000348 [Gnathostoma spinigerum]|uniref:NudC domain-containing protein 1 n=1 Tax=Gnathostoma spinigerum TaxID=75299 RepID=A0ABD6E8G0_9BILA